MSGAVGASSWVVRALVLPRPCADQATRHPTSDAGSFKTTACAAPAPAAAGAAAAAAAGWRATTMDATGGSDSGITGFRPPYRSGSGPAGTEPNSCR